MKYLIFFLTVLTASFSYAQEKKPLTPQKTGLLIYHSWVTNNNLGEVLSGDRLDFKFKTMDSIDLSRELAPDNPLTKLLPFVSVIEAAFNLTKRLDPNGTIYEFDPYLLVRWKKFPWNGLITTTFAIGDGLSYASGIPLREEIDSDIHNPKHLLNLVVIEATAALPSHRDLQLVVRVHHRCGAWGFFGAGNLSSNAVGIGVRYLF
jgi:hypothetical protein